MADRKHGEAETEAEIEHQATEEDIDPVTSREALEEDLMDEGKSEAGEFIP
jgi:hypothetical protein